MRKIMAVDDDPLIRSLLSRILKRKGFEMAEAENGKQALDIVKKERPDLILLDLNMPEMNGFEVIHWLRVDPEFQLIPIIVLTAYGQEKISALEAGANDFLVKPFEQAELLARIGVHLRLRESMEHLENAENVIITMARMVEARDRHTEMHVERVADTAAELGNLLGLSDLDLDDLRKGAFLHDIGKIGIKESILNKPGPLTPEERDQMIQHPLIGEKICKPLKTFSRVLPIIRHHHERWDGRGYPDGLAGDEIPFLARIVTAVDVMDALTSDRPYRKALPEEKAKEYLEGESGGHFDPVIVRELLRLKWPV